ncbi:MAG TPA: RNA polymerase sigma-70 factor [Acidimicrobiales bacterium]
MSEGGLELETTERDRLFGLAYRLLGRASEAEDAVQETFSRWAAADQQSIENPAAWLTTVCTNLCIDILRSARVQRETYVGPWLPEPVATEVGGGEDASELAESVSLAFLVVLESLSPLERVVFVLHDVFGHPHEEIAAVLGKSPAAVRQLASRARRRVHDAQPRFEADAARRSEVADAFLAACTGADLDQLLELLAPDVVLVADGGGVVPSIRHPAHGVDKVAAVLLRLASQLPPDTDLRRLEVNAMPGIVAFIGGRLDTVVALDIVDGRVGTVRIIRNPDKLKAFAAHI